MFTVDEIVEKACEYQRSRISLVEFDHWFEQNWDECAADADPAIAAARAAVDGALAQYYFDHIGEQAFRKKLAAAVSPFGRIALLSEDSAVRSSIPVVPIQNNRSMPAPTLALVAASLMLLPAIVEGLRSSETSSASRVEGRALSIGMPI